MDRILAEMGFDMEKLKEDMQSEEVQAEIARNLGLAERLGIQGTPTFIVGERLIPGAFPEAEFLALMEGASAAQQ